MTRKRVDPVEEKLDLLVRLTQDLFILHSLQAGVSSHQVAAMLSIDKRRVSKISKHLKTPKR